MIYRGQFLLVAGLCALVAIAADTPPGDDQLWEHRNLGKAFYENPDTHLQAVDQLKAALQLDPDSVRERINFGLALLHAGKTDEAVLELMRAQKQDPSIPHTWFNLGIVYKHAGDYEKAIEQFEGMIRLVPGEPAGHYNLAAVLRSKGEIPAALLEFQKSEKLNPDLAGPHFQLFTLFQRSHDADAALRERQSFEEVKKRNEGAAVPEDMEWCFYAELYDPPQPRASVEAEPTRYQDRIVSKGWDPATAGMTVIDVNSDGHADLLVWSRDRLELLKHGTEPATNSGLEDLRGIESVAAGDFDNDGYTDLCVVTSSGAALLRNDHGTFKKTLELPKSAGVTKALWLDYDHDYDLDLLLLGPNPVLLRNDGNGKFEDRTSAFPFVKGKPLDAVVFAIRSDTAARDVVVSYADRSAVLYTDKLNGIFEPGDIPALPSGAGTLDVQDLNDDGLLDLLSFTPTISAVLNKSGRLESAGVSHVAASPIRADFNGDNREDHARILPDGSLHLYLDDSANRHWATVRLKGVKNLKSANNATVEMASGPYYKKQIYHGFPLAFAMDGRADADTIRITWPNGLIQNETHKKSGQALNIEEAQRLSGSCPMIFAWNGHAFEFITDVLGVAPLGASSGDGSYFPVDHDEYIQIPGSSLLPQNGSFQIHITEELHEVSYLDKVQLIAVDHASDIDIYTNDKFKSPPYPEFRLFGAGTRVHPVRALEDGRVDATERVSKRDLKYPDSFSHDSAGVASLHTLDLDFGKAASANRAALVLNGWVDWADGSTFLGASQATKDGLIFPYLQVKNSSGAWKTVVKDMGIPSGKPKTIVVDLTDKFLSSSREVRIVTNLCVYWDEIFLLENSTAPQVRLTPVDAETADVHFRGFSRAVIDPMRQQPEKFVYDDVRSVSSWNPTPGFYTKYGDVEPLITSIDDKLVVMGSGEELSLKFPADRLPPLASGWSRDYLLLVDGWAKDADANTAFSQSTTPLPFHAMSAYPYKRDEHFPNDADHARYLSEYFTRPALKLIRPLAPIHPVE